jgi:vancomycin permeability regulator SanA
VALTGDGIVAPVMLLRRTGKWLSVSPRRWLRRGFVAGGVAAVLALVVVAGGEVWVRVVAKGRVYSVASVPSAPVALVLGAQVYADGTPSPFLAARLDLARQLLGEGKVKAILVSGDHGRWDYDEPGDMEVYLEARGVPAARIAVDYAGFDTYDSCSRARRVFGVRQAIVVTQSYHIDRALAVCRALGVDATGVADSSVSIYKGPWRRSVVREQGAIVKAVYDVASRRDPVYLGRHETSVEDAVRAG